MSLKSLFKSFFTWTLSTFLLGPSLASAEVLHWPQLCQKGLLQVRNKSQQELKAWLQKFSENQIEETELSIPALGFLKFRIESTTALERFSLLHFAASESLSAQFNCEKGQAPAQPNEGGVITFKKTNLKNEKLWIQNLYSAENLIQIDYLDRGNRVLLSEVLNLKSFQQFNYATTENNLPWSKLKIAGANRFTAFQLNSQGAQKPFQIEVQYSTPLQKAHYFLVGPRLGFGDSFVIRLTDPLLLEKARDLVAHPEREKIIFAKVEKGHQDFNRNFSKSEKSFWSWSVSEVTNFADIGSTTCNGIPQLLEDHLDLWLQDPGRICFWNYRLKKELSFSEVSGH